jgi:RimJ/RimL family protein N-acetyltransferase
MADADAIYAIHGDPLATRYMGGTLTREQSLDNLRALIVRVEDTGYGPFAVERRNDAELIGWSGVQQLPGYPMIEIIFAFETGSWGHGYATEVSAALLRQCFSQVGLHEVVATVDPRNLASIRVLNKLGFESVGPITHKLNHAQGILYRVTPERFGRYVASPQS